MMATGSHEEGYVEDPNGILTLNETKLAEDETQDLDSKYYIEQLLTAGIPGLQETEERFDTLSQRSFGSTRSRASSTSSSKRAAADTAALKAKMISLKKRQDLDRELEGLKRRQKELERLAEQENLQGELDAAKARQYVLEEQEEHQVWNDTLLVKEAKNPVITETIHTTPQQLPVNEGQPTSMNLSDREIIGSDQRVKNMQETVRKGATEDCNNPRAIIPGQVGIKTSVFTAQPNSSTPAVSQPTIPPHLDANTPSFYPPGPTYQNATLPGYLPNQPSLYGHTSLMSQAQFQQIQRDSTIIQQQQVELLKRMTLPVPKPPIFTGDILEYPKWASAFDALIEEEAVKPGHKLYYLGEYTSGVAQKMISGLLGLQTEDAYRRARKVLNERFGDPFRIYEAYRERLKTWPLCTMGAELQEFSDFVVMTQETMKTPKILLMPPALCELPSLVSFVICN